MDAGTPTLRVRTVVLAYAGILGVWTLAWQLKASVIDAAVPWLSTSLGSFLWWTTAKVLLWVLPALWLIAKSGRSLRDVVGAERWKRALLWGGGIGSGIALTGLVPAYLQGHPLLPTEFSIPLFSVLVVAPLLEELLFRGAMLGALQPRLPFWVANVVSSLMFVGMHVPGWYFMGNLVENLSRPLGGAFSIFLLGMAFGYAAHKSKSVMGGMVAHFLNNLAPHV